MGLSQILYERDEAMYLSSPPKNPARLPAVACTLYSCCGIIEARRGVPAERAARFAVPDIVRIVRSKLSWLISLSLLLFRLN